MTVAGAPRVKVRAPEAAIAAVPPSVDWVPRRAGAAPDPAYRHAQECVGVEAACAPTNTVTLERLDARARGLVSTTVRRCHCPRRRTCGPTRAHKGEVWPANV